MATAGNLRESVLHRYAEYCSLVRGRLRQLDGILARHTAQSLQRIRKDTERDYFMNPRDAMEYGLIDDILQRRDSFPSN